MVGIADVDAFVPKQTPIDQHAARETTTVYTGVRNFPMLPEELSTGKTSLLENQDRLSVVIEFVVDSAGNMKSPDVYRAVVRNKAQLQYNSTRRMAGREVACASEGRSIQRTAGATETAG